MRNTDDERLFYSPPVGIERHIDRILIAYHAFANVLIFYRLGIDRALISEARAERFYGKYKAYVQHLGETLENAGALTELAESIYRPLKEELAAVSP
jgi:HEXXH motif-containing protein